MLSVTAVVPLFVIDMLSPVYGCDVASDTALMPPPEQLPVLYGDKPVIVEPDVMGEGEVIVIDEPEPT